MRTSQLTENNDWRFGQSLNDYLSDADAIHQNIKTRLQCFKSDWWLDVGSGLPWLTLLGQRGSGEILRREVYKTALGTEGVVRIDRLDITVREHCACIEIDYTDAFSNRRTIVQEVQA